ncbi:MAG: glycoside hydrolase family 3 N-terminal domain-containing protein [Myxococcales bacterium]|nr:glycoside hydrolase family 3 N-terminal domain-containing protein [Myxococcales bacterium]
MNRIVLAVGAALLFTGCPRGGIDTDGGTSDGGPVCDTLSARAHIDCTQAEAKSALQLLRSMSTEEKVQQMSGPPYNPNNFFDQEDNTRLRVPGFKYMDGPRGVRWYNSDYGTTVFPAAIARGASWDVELERRIGKSMAREMRYLGRHVLLAPTINQVTHPRWGRAQESYGEDTFLLGQMGVSLIKGIQFDPNVVDPAEPGEPTEDSYRIQACVKHYAANNVEDTRIYVNAVLDERTLREVYLPHFKKAVEADVACVMTSYNRVNGSYSGFSTELVRNILKKQWGYSGFVISDWFAKGQTVPSATAGLDVEMPFSSGAFPSQFDSAYFYGAALVTAVNNGQVPGDVLDEAVLRILYSKTRFGDLAHDFDWRPFLTKADTAQALALQAARESIVLLKNGPTRALSDDVLPLDKATVSRISVVGKFANSENMGDKGSSDARVVDGALVITPFEGLQEAVSGTAAQVRAYENVAGNEAAIGASDVVVVIGAYFYADLARSSSGEEGEWKDRTSMQLPQRDLTNIANAVALKAANPTLKVVVVMKSGGAVLVSGWVAGVDAVLMAWFAGMKEGTALAEVLFGDTNPSAKMVQSVPVQESDLPSFDNAVTGDLPYQYFHGYRWLEKRGIAAQYPFGYGQSFTTFAYSNLRVTSSTIAPTGTLEVKVDVKNTGMRAGSEVVQLYVGFEGTAVADTWGRPKKQLEAFARLADLAPGATRTATLTVKAEDLAFWDVAAKAMTVEKMAYQLFVGPSSDSADPQMQTGTFTIQ